MHISEFCVKRPVFSIVITLFIILIGVISGSKLPVQLMPLVERPSIEVKGEYVGASPAMVEMQVTKVLEGYLSTITGVEEMRSDSKADESEIILKFNIGTKLEDAVNDVRDAVSKAMSEELPDTMKMPTITKYNPDASPIIQFAIKSKGIDLLKVKDYAERYIKNKFEILDGVAKVEVYGGSKYAMNLILDPIKLAGHKVSVTEVREAVQKQNFESPAGRIIGKDREFAITVMANLKTPQEFDNIVVATRGDNIIRLKDIGKAELGEKEVREKSYFNGEEVIGLAIYKQSSANPVSISKKAHELLEKQKQDLPDNIEIVVSNDETDYIKDSIFHVYKTIAEAIIFVILVIYLFLWSFRASLVPLLAIPVSLIGVLAFLNLMGFSINNLTLLAMVLAIGLVVDDAIVILENIYKKMEEGQSKMKAVIEGTKEITFSVIAMTFTLVAVYIPLAFSFGASGLMFREFAVVLAGSVVISGVVALTLSPMMCGKFLKTDDVLHSKDNFGTAMLGRIDFLYKKSLELAFMHKAKVMILTLGFIVFGTIIGLYFVPQESSPYEDRSMMYIDSDVPRGASLEYTNKYGKALASYMQKLPEVENTYLNISPTEIRGRAVLKQINKRKKSGHEIAKDAEDYLEDNLPGVDFHIEGRQRSGADSDAGKLTFYLTSARKREYLEEISEDFIQSVMSEGVLDNVTTSVGVKVRDFWVDINRDRVSSLGVDMKAVADTIKALLNGEKIGHFTKMDNKYEVRIELSKEMKSSFNIFDGIYIPLENKGNNDDSKLVPVSDFITLDPKMSAINIIRYQQLRATSYSGQLAGKYNTGNAVSKITKMHRANVPKDVFLEFTGDVKRFKEDSSNAFYILILSLIFIFLILAAQFESFVDPLLIILTVPCAIVGGVLLLWVVPGCSVNIYSNIGFVTLIGLITKHGILIIDYTNKYMENGMEAMSSIKKACLTRIRPILMTTFAMVLGALPLAIASGAGSENRRQIGCVVVGGMIIGTLFTIIILPIILSFIKTSKKLIKKQ